MEGLQSRTGVPVVELDDILHTFVTDGSKSEYQIMGCWSVAEAGWGSGHQGYGGSLHKYGLKIEVYPLPDDLHGIWRGRIAPQMLTHFDLDVDKAAWLEKLAEQAKQNPTNLTTSVGRIIPSVMQSPPNDRLLCFDDIYYLSDRMPHNAAFPDIPVYRQTKGPFTQVGQYMRFSKKLDLIVDGILKEVFGSSNPKYLALHIRHGDFPGRKSLAEYSQALDEVRNRARPVLPEVDTLPVLAVSDDTSQEFADHAREQGWTLYSHEKHQTEEIYNAWYPAIIDSALLARSHGMVGTRHSTFSLIAMLRVNTWQKMPVMFPEDSIGNDYFK